ncbi:hypothetical protein GR11A_00086 [Vibrio phage vB_VcorM_GR11A]|nr:hypothetical protein GR11A_00086 [Vibrio phage vB_VcorM_GR11A]
MTTQLTVPEAYNTLTTVIDEILPQLARIFKEHGERLPLGDEARDGILDTLVDIEQEVRRYYVANLSDDDEDKENTSGAVANIVEEDNIRFLRQTALRILRVIENNKMGLLDTLRRANNMELRLLDQGVILKRSPNDVSDFLEKYEVDDADFEAADPFAHLKELPKWITAYQRLYTIPLVASLLSENDEDSDEPKSCIPDSPTLRQREIKKLAKQGAGLMTRAAAAIKKENTRKASARRLTNRQLSILKNHGDELNKICKDVLGGRDFDSLNEERQTLEYLNFFIDHITDACDKIYSKLEPKSKSKGKKKLDLAVAAYLQAKSNLKEQKKLVKLLKKQLKKGNKK